MPEELLDELDGLLELEPLESDPLESDDRLLLDSDGILLDDRLLNDGSELELLRLLPDDR